MQQTPFVSTFAGTHRLYTFLNLTRTMKFPCHGVKKRSLLQCCSSLHTLGIGGMAPLDISQMRELLKGSAWKQLCEIVCYDFSKSFLNSVFTESIPVNSTSRPRLCVCDSHYTVKNISKEVMLMLEVFKCGHL